MSLNKPFYSLFRNLYHSFILLFTTPRKRLYFQQKKDTRQVLVLPVLCPNLWIVYFANLWIVYFANLWIVYFANFVNSVCYKLTISLIIPILLQQFL